MDKRRNNGGHRTAGRKPKADELKIIERMDMAIDSDKALSKLNKLIEEGNLQAIKLYLQYRYGQPKEQIDVTTEMTSGIDFNELIKYVKE